MAILLAFAMIFTMVDPSIFGGTITVQAEETVENVKSGWVSDTPGTEGYDTYNITTEGEMVAIALYFDEDNEVGQRYRSANYVLYTDLKFGEADHNRINIGSGKHPFTGTFDGQGHTITGLWGDAQVALNNGLFGVMKGATVKNVVIKGADYRSNQYGGILAAQAIDSTIQNVTIINSSCKVASLGAVIGLITTGGLYGGALVGYAQNTKIYNCESRDTKVYVDTTGGVQALGGDGMYMGGLVGWLEDGSILEYSRVIGGSVSTEYYVAVGALAANNLYAGGVVGCLDGDDARKAQVLDCFSSANVNYKGECYVSVGAGLSGYAGGIAARVSGSNYAMERCHYAGNIHGRLVNSILVLPIVVMEDYYLGGVAGTVKDTTYITDCYFNWENAVVGNKYPGGPKLPAIWGESNTGEFTVIGSDQYADTSSFDDFDFNGTIDRSTGNAAPFDGVHNNKWVIDPVNNMPIHGKRVEATLDFPGAGTITFEKTSIYDATSTSTNEKNISQIAQVHADMDEELTLTATVNDGYVFDGWYLKGTETKVDHTVKTIDGVDYYTIKLGGTDPNNYPCNDGDVFEARYHAKVTFMKWDKETSQETVLYSYGAPLKFVTAEAPEGNYLFLGWTESKNWSQTDKTYDKDSLYSSDLSDIKFVEEDEIIRGPRTLYPVFIRIENYNVKVQLQTATPIDENTPHIKGEEGEEGTASIITNANGDLCLTITPKEGINEDSGYRFDGWYELEVDAEGNVQATCVSKKMEFSLKNVDLSKSHRYEARYKYRVNAWIPMKTGGGQYTYGINGSDYGSYYLGYGESFNDEVASDPTFTAGEMIFYHWAKTNSISRGEEYEKSTLNDMRNEYPESSIVIERPADVYAIVHIDATTYYPSLVKTDFPVGTKQITMDIGKGPLRGPISATISIKEGYNFNGFWRYHGDFDGSAWELENSLTDENELKNKTEYKWTTEGGLFSIKQTIILARVTADINFNRGGGTVTTVERKYNSLLFCNDESKVENWDAPNSDYVKTPDYKDPGNTVVGTGATPSREDMYRAGYHFIGWTTESTDNKTLYNTEEEFVTTNISVAEGFVLDEASARVTEAMTLNPVYAKYNITFDTNFGAPNEGDTTKPAIPVGTVTDDGTLTITSGELNGYDFQDWIITRDGVEISIESLKDENGNLKVDPIKEYKFTAVYKATVSFNNAQKDKDGNVSDKTASYEAGEKIIGDKITELPVSQLPVNEEEYTVNMGDNMDFTGKKVFVGWEALPYNEKAPDNEYKFEDMGNLGGISFIDKDSTVDKAMNLWPIYTEPNISLDTNIGSAFENDGAKPSVTISKEGSVTLNAPGVPGYEFAGWKEKNGTENLTTESSYTLAPEDLRGEHTYIACYNPVITYYSPSVDENNNISYIDNAITVDYGLTFEDIEDKLVSNQDKLGDKYSFKGWTTTKNGTEPFNPEEQITKGIVLYPIIRGENNQQIFIVTVYSNMDDSAYEIGAVSNNGLITFPKEDYLNKIGLEAKPSKGIGNEDVTPQFVGYSLVTIKEDGTRTSDGLYAIEQEIASTKLSEYNGTDSNKRIYAVWAQIETLPEARIYLGNEHNKGLLSMTAVNTSILVTAGLQEMNGTEVGQCGYDRYSIFTNGTNLETALILNNGRKIWDNKEYREYFTTNPLPENWNVYGGIMYNIPKSFYTRTLGFNSRLKFTYADGEETCTISATEKIDKTCTIQAVALEMLKENGTSDCPWEFNQEQIDLLNQYAGNE